jgi:hypothetical protein
VWDNPFYRPDCRLQMFGISEEPLKNKRSGGFWLGLGAIRDAKVRPGAGLSESLQGELGVPPDGGFTLTLETATTGRDTAG